MVFSFIFHETLPPSTKHDDERCRSWIRRTTVELRLLPRPGKYISLSILPPHSSRVVEMDITIIRINACSISAYMAITLRARLIYLSNLQIHIHYTYTRGVELWYTEIIECRLNWCVFNYRICPNKCKFPQYTWTNHRTKPPSIDAIKMFSIIPSANKLNWLLGARLSEIDVCSNSYYISNMFEELMNDWITLVAKSFVVES